MGGIFRLNNLIMDYSGPYGPKVDHVGYYGTYGIHRAICNVMEHMGCHGRYASLVFENLSLSQRSFPSPQAEAAGPATGMHKTSDEKNASQFHVSSLFLCFGIFFFFDFRIFFRRGISWHFHLNIVSFIFFPLSNLAVVGGGFKNMQILIDLNSKYLFRIPNPLDHILHPPPNVVWSNIRISPKNSLLEKTHFLFLPPAQSGRLWVLANCEVHS